MLRRFVRFICMTVCRARPVTCISLHAYPDKDGGGYTIRAVYEIYWWATNEDLIAERETVIDQCCEELNCVRDDLHIEGGSDCDSTDEAV